MNRVDPQPVQWTPEHLTLLSPKHCYNVSFIGSTEAIKFRDYYLRNRRTADWRIVAIPEQCG